MAENKVRFLRGTAAEYANAVKDDDTFYYTTDDEKFYVGSKEITGGGITVDSELSDTSTNPVQNKVIKAAIDDKADKTTATTGTDGLMSSADKTKLDNVDNTYALKSKYGDTTIDVGRKSGTTIGSYSTAEGYSTTASGDYSHAEGAGTTASGLASHAGGRYTKALHMNEVAYGNYNQSNDDTLFSIGDGTADDARHNAFEITATGGKLHDKDIATTDMSLPANGGNADTVGGYHASDFVRTFNGVEMDNNRILIPNDAHVGNWLKGNAEIGMLYYRSPDSSGQTGLPDADEINNWAWFLYDGLTYFAKTIYNRFFFMDYINSYNGWIEIYTSNSKPYVTGTVSGWEVASSGTAPIEYTVLDFTPSFVIYVFNNGITDFATPITNGFRIVINSSSGTSAKYFAFK